MSDTEKQQHELENADKSLFIQELFLSSLIEGFNTGRFSPLQVDRSPVVENSSPPTEHIVTSPQTDDVSSHLVNGENVSEPYPATTKSCNVGHLTNDRIWDLSDAENCNSPTDDTSENEADDDDEQAAEEEECGSAATEMLQKESKLL